MPEFQVTNVTENSIELGWKGPSQEHKKDVDYYKIKLDNETKTESTEKTDITYKWGNLTCGTNYTVAVGACSHKHTPDECSMWSGEEGVRTKECKNTASAPSFQQQANGILVIMIGLCFLNKYHA